MCWDLSCEGKDEGPGACGAHVLHERPRPGTVGTDALTDGGVGQ